MRVGVGPCVRLGSWSDMVSVARTQRNVAFIFGDVLCFNDRGPLAQSVKKNFTPLFTHVKAHVDGSTQVGRYDLMVDGDATTELATRMLHWLHYQSRCADPPDLVDAVPFLWTFCDVDVDLMGWHHRFPFRDAIVSIIDRLSCAELEALRAQWSGVSTRLVTFLQLFSLYRCVGAADRIRPADVVAIYPTLSMARRLFRARSWAMRQALHRASCGFAAPRVADYAFGGLAWTDLLARVGD